MSKTMTFVAIVPSLETRLRLQKMGRIAKDAGIGLRLWGWKRKRDAIESWQQGLSICDDNRMLISGGGYSNHHLLPLYILWVFQVFRYALWNAPNRVHALGIESAFPVALAGVFRRDIRLIYDDADRLSYCHALPRPARWGISALEQWTSKRCHVHIVPGMARYPEGIDERKSVILRNTPTDIALQASATITVLPPKPAHELRILVTGWIGDVRGSRHARDLAVAMQDCNHVRFIAAGRLTGQAAEEFVSLGNVEFLGSRSNAEALALCRECDLVLTLYDPAIRINRYAEPNKWGDCIAVGTPFVVNREVKTAVPLLDAGAGFAFAYSAPNELNDLIRSLDADRTKLVKAQECLALLREKQASFDETYRHQVLEH